MPPPGDKADEHALYVRSEWKKFLQIGLPLQRVAAQVAPSPRRVLDVGCGAGQELLPYLETIAIGVDVRRSGLEEGRSLFGARAPFLLLAAGERLPFTTAAFDVVLCRLALPYMDVHAALGEMTRVLAPGGALVVQAHHLRYYLRRALRGPALLDRLHALRVIARGTVFELTRRQPPGEVFQLHRSLRRILEAAGCEVLHVDESDRGAPILLARRITPGSRRAAACAPPAS